MISATFKLKLNAEKVIARIRRQALSGLVREAEELIADSKENYCPVDTGNLRNRGFVRPNPDTLSVAVGFDAEYAAVVHEDLTAKHPVGQAKYLTTPMNKRAKALGTRVAKVTFK